MMKTMTLELEIAADGSLRLDVPFGLPPGRAEVVLVVQPLPQPQPPFASLAGAWQSYFPADFDSMAALREIRQEWEGEWK